jgi:hypothetical protein
VYKALTINNNFSYLPFYIIARTLLIEPFLTDFLSKVYTTVSNQIVTYAFRKSRAIIRRHCKYLWPLGQIEAILVVWPYAAADGFFFSPIG